MSKRLFLASEAKHPTSFSLLDSFVGSFTNKRIAYIPTAANGQGYGSWKAGGSYQLVQTIGAKVDVIELENFNDTNIIDQLGHPDILWFSGGMPGYLLYWLHRLNLVSAIHDLISNGAVYVGSSAGSMVCSATQVIAASYPGEADPAAAYLPGLGLIDFEIFPHYEDTQLDLIKSLWTKGELRLLKNGEAITVVDQTVTTLGVERLITK